MTSGKKNDFKKISHLLCTFVSVIRFPRHHDPFCLVVSTRSPRSLRARATPPSAPRRCVASSSRRVPTRSPLSRRRARFSRARSRRRGRVSAGSPFPGLLHRGSSSDASAVPAISARSARSTPRDRACSSPPPTAPRHPSPASPTSAASRARCCARTRWCMKIPSRTFCSPSSCTSTRRTASCSRRGSRRTTRCSAFSRPGGSWSARPRWWARETARERRARSSGVCSRARSTPPR